MNKKDANGGRAIKPLTSYDKAFAYIRLHTKLQSYFIIWNILLIFIIIFLMNILFEGKIYLILSSIILIILLIISDKFFKNTAKEIDNLKYLEELKKKKW